jgi:alpha-L-arabinofuranosidase
LTGYADIEDTFENQKAVVPAVSTIKVSSHFDYIIPAISLTVIRIASKK